MLALILFIVLPISRVICLCESARPLATLISSLQPLACRGDKGLAVFAGGKLAQNAGAPAAYRGAWRC